MKQTCKKLGYQKIPQREPLILKPEDWTPEEWAVLCKLSGLPPDRTERIVLYIREVEAYLGRGRKSIRPKPAQTPQVKVDIVVKDGQVSEVYAGGGAVQVKVLDLDTDEPHRRARLQKQYALLLKLFASGEITDIF